MTDVLQAAFVFTALAVALVVPPWCTARRVASRRDAGTVALTALLLGAGSQALLGFAWDRMLLRTPAAAAALYYGLWGLLTLGAMRGSARSSRETPRGAAAPKKAVALMGIILLAAVLVRSLHPIAHAALGQSDAYGHLQFLRQVVGEGMLLNRVYPPGFAWIMALPVLTFRLDPYYVARYAGAFWGAGLTLGMIVLAGHGERRGRGYLAGALVAVCPLFLPLLKTGVGMFATQFGLFLVPVLLYAGLRLDRGRARLALALGAAACAAAVPMMLIALLPVLLLDRFFALAVRAPGAKRMAIAALISLLPAGALMVGQALAIRGIHRDATVEIMTERPVAPAPRADGREESAPGERAPGLVRHVLGDLFSVKRAGYGHPVFNLVAGVLAAMFLAALIAGQRRDNPSLRLLGVFGLVTSLQAGTGMLQFSAYQREGWSLLLAVAWLGAVVCDSVLDQAPLARRHVTRALVTGFLLCLAVSLRYPPGHALLFSRAEDDLVRIARAAAREAQDDPTRLPLTLIARSFTGFAGNQGDVLPAVIGSSDRVKTRSLGPGVPFERLLRDPGEYLVLIDHEPITEADLPTVFSALRGDVAAHFLREHRRLFALNRAILDGLARIPVGQWTLETEYRDATLTAVRIRPRL